MPPNPTEPGPGGFFDTAMWGKKDKNGRKKRNNEIRKKSENRSGKTKPKRRSHIAA